MLSGDTIAAGMGTLMTAIASDTRLGAGRRARATALAAKYGVSVTTKQEDLEAIGIITEAISKTKNSS